MFKSRFCVAILLFALSIFIFGANTSSAFAAGYTVFSGQSFNAASGTLDAAGGDINNTGTLLSSSGTFKLDGNWTNTGTFNSGINGTVEFTGSTDSTIKGDNTFTNFKCTQAGKLLNFEAGKTQIIEGAWTITGAPGSLIALRSTVEGVQWRSVGPPTNDLSFVDVKDANNLGGTIIDPVNSIDSGNNTNWFNADEVTTTTRPRPTTTPLRTTTTRQRPTMTTTTTRPTTTTLPLDIAPIAEFKSDVIGGFVPLTVTFTDLSTGDPASWQWEFGDGDVSDEQNPMHIYNFEGEFTVKLTVTNGAGSDTEVKTGLISADPPGDCKANFNADKTSGFVPLEVQFTDISTGSPTSWQWEFGDGDISAVQNPVHTYQTAGIYSVTLTISGACGSDVITRTNLITAESIPEPVAEFSANPGAGFAPLDVEFENLSTGDPTSFAWTFGDGGSSSEENPDYTYESPGIYTPSLLVSNENGADLEIKTNLINIDSGGELPTPEFTASPQEGPEPLNVQFTDKSTGNVESRVWDFGDGVTSSLQNPVHEYINEGFYNVILTVSGKDGDAFEKKNDFIEILEPDEDVVAVFDVASRTGNAPFTVHFFDKSSGAISDRIWDFGDEEISDEQNPVHIYETPGLFDVELVIFADNGRGERLEEEFITVEDGVKPTAGFDADKNSGEDDDSNGDGTKNLTVNLSDLSSSPDDEIIEREWDFGDGTKSSDKNPKHTFTGEEGDAFTVSLAVVNSDGLDTVTKSSFISIESSIGTGFVEGRITDKKSGDNVEGARCCLETKAGV